MKIFAIPVPGSGNRVNKKAGDPIPMVFQPLSPNALLDHELASDSLKSCAICADQRDALRRRTSVAHGVNHRAFATTYFVSMNI
jgi:hypothetical protein